MSDASTKTVRRYDTGKLGQAERTPQGGLRIPARLTRVGIFEYLNPDGSVRRELRPPEEVFAPASMASLRGAPLTNLHVAEITPVNFSQYAKGHVGDDVAPDDIFVAAHAYVQDAAMISLIEGGQRKEISLGYDARIDETPGVWEGQPYDSVQRDIRYNHAALGPEGWGRAGGEVALRLDGGGDAIPPRGEDGPTSRPEALEDGMADKKIEIIRGVEYEVGSAPHSAAVKRRDGEVEDLEAEIERLKTKLAEMKAKADEDKKELEDENKELEEKVEKADEEKAEIEKKMDSIVAKRAIERTRLILAARDHKVEVRTDASDHELRIALLAKLAPESRFDAKDSKDKERATIVLDHELERIEKSNERKGLGALANGIQQNRRDAASQGLGSKVESARAEASKKRADAWKSKSN